MPYANPEDHRRWWRKRRSDVYAEIAEAKDRPCADCGVAYPRYVMQFDHVRGEKSFTIGHAVRAVRSMEALREEIAKCDIVSANCHAIRTHGRGYHNPRTCE